MAKTQYQAESLHQLDSVAKEIAGRLKPGMVVGLIGPLGAGKTTLVKAVAKQLGVKEQVISPTYLYHQVYDTTRLRLHHLDLYRLKSQEDFEALDIPIHDEGGLFLIEWIDNIPELMAQADICFKISVKGESRLIEEVPCQT